ncbi:spore germination protein [Brevibacillus sp. FSL L8-0710]|uniref:spore germination protein n=1 Tax=Brevibacillus sp. FSL L8-0710 TaxID=2975313 RepID=UPI0030F92B31
MFRRVWEKWKNEAIASCRKQQSSHSDQQASNKTPLSESLQENLDIIKQRLGNPQDLIIRPFLIDNSGRACAVACIDGLVDSELVHDKVVKHIQLLMSPAGKAIPAPDEDIMAFMLNEVLSIIEVKTGTTMEEVLDAMLVGDTAFFVDGSHTTILIDSRGWETRGIEEPVSEGLVRGPRDGFNENIRDNTVRIRRRVRDPKLRFDATTVGRRSKTDLIVAYIEDIAHPNIVNEIKRRISTIDIDQVEESGYIEQWIEDNFLSPFPQVQNTERPDKVASALFQGRVAIILDGTPMVLLAPVTLGIMLHSPEDFYERWMVGSLARVLRYLASYLAVFSPALYIALVTFHPGLIPSDLAFSIAATRDGVPFPAAVESLIMVTTMELLQEAGLRLPKPIGQTVGIVGGLVIGEAAVSAGIVSPVMVIVVAITAIASFAIPSYNLAIAFRMIRFGAMLAAAMFGLYGVVLAFILIVIHLTNLTSIGVPYLAPLAPQLVSDWKDYILRAPITFFKKRPDMLQTKDKTRLKAGRSQ